MAVRAKGAGANGRVPLRSPSCGPSVHVHKLPAKASKNLDGDTLTASAKILGFTARRCGPQPVHNVHSIGRIEYVLLEI